jgi:hypothetical protein
MISCPGMGPFGYRELPLFPEPVENKNFSEMKRVSFPNKNRDVPKILDSHHSLWSF